MYSGLSIKMAICLSSETHYEGHIKIVDFSSDVKPKGCLLDTETMPWKEPRTLCRRETKEEKHKHKLVLTACEHAPLHLLELHLTLISRVVRQVSFTQSPPDLIRALHISLSPSFFFFLFLQLKQCQDQVLFRRLLALDPFS